MNSLVEAINQSVQARSAGSSPEARFRRDAWVAHENLGWPDRKTETWRYTTCAALLKSNLSMDAVEPTLNTREQGVIAEWSRNFEVVVIKNGQLISGAKAQPLDWDRLRSSQFQWTDGFAPAMAAAAQGGAWISLNLESTRPTLIAHLFDGTVSGRSTLNVIEIADGAKGTIVELWDGEGRGLSSTQTLVMAGHSSRVSFVRLVRPQPEMQHFDDCQIQLQAQAELHFLNVHLGSLWSRSSVVTTLIGSEARAHLSGMAFGKDQQHSDQRVEVRHLAANTFSRQLFKGVWRDQARGVINGKIYIAPQAQKVDSAQLNHNLLLSSRAEVDTKPELEVYADDVKANHGASIGRMDDEKLFYFLSRGISHSQAVHLLAEGFVKDVLLKIDDPFLQDWLMSEIQKILPQFASGLEGART